MRTAGRLVELKESALPVECLNLAREDALGKIYETVINLIGI